ncbi:MAG: hypothetical protein LBE83_06370, partial [Propionibacteriaceae bacterium]|nr:hypothetical protein [Propionibacteriaceae bacterium]
MKKTSRISVGVIVITVVIGLAGVDGVVAPAFADPVEWHGFQRPGDVSVRELEGKSPESAPEILERELRAEWPADSGEPGGRVVRVERDRVVQVGSSVVSLVVAEGSRRSSVDARVRVLGLEQAEELVGTGLVLMVDLPAGADVEVRGDYSAFADAVGGAFGSRLRLVGLPDCGLSTPDLVGCRAQSSLVSVNDPDGLTVSTVLSVPGGPVAPSGRGGEIDELVIGGSVYGSSGSTMLLGVVAGVSSDEGDYSALPLPASSSWETGGWTGDFSWSYPLRVPDVPAGFGPELVLSYSSGSTDGAVSTTNNHSSWVGEGF